MTPNRNRKRQKKNSNIPAFLLILVGMLIVVGAISLIAIKFKSFQAHTDTYGPFTHVIGTAEFVPPADIWSDKNVSRYENEGVGLSIPFVKILTNGKSYERKFELEGWSRRQEEGDNPKHRAKVRDARKRFEEMVAWVNTRESYPIRKLVVVDMTGGIGGKGSESLSVNFVAEEVGLPQLKESFDVGDSIELVGCKISAEREVDCRQSKADKNHPFKSVEDVGNWLAEKSPDTKETSFYEGFYNIVDWLAVNHIMIPPEIKIVSDTTENSPETANFYNLAKEGKLKDAKAYPAIFDQIYARKMKVLFSIGFINNPENKNPDNLIMHGVSVTIVGPPYGKGAVRDRIEQSLAFAQYVFADRFHANVNIRYR
jgi:hypothetical protein